jgi:phytoene synthase
MIGLAESQAYCARVTRLTARNFVYGIRLLPRERRVSMEALYAFLRRTDDLADQEGNTEEKRKSLQIWRAVLARVIECGDPANSTWEGMPALHAAVVRHSIRAEDLHAVIDGVEMDLEPRPFDTFAELEVYCERVASAVGLLCLAIWGYRSEGGRAESLARDCGVALQLTNILRDIREDATAGRLYLPLEDLRRFGVALTDLSADPPPASVFQLLEFEARRASELYGAADRLEPLVDPVGRPMLRAVVGVYKGLLERIEARGWDVFSERVALPGWRKAWIAMRSALGSTNPRMWRAVDA